ncbi:antigen 5 like allergen Cul n 1-like [Lucilia cuprina]|uniref:antigen 5 like allergen Cul n 1-like n=1 Tax=Lucilia cuprina TaxID=7375 RepID=UPI001F05785B|nr:antigen 5 like allergen Cul n 1-like [Lucilia cuprina]
MNKFIAICCIAILFDLAKATDYCSDSICDGKKGSHIACDHDGEFSSSCPDDAEMVEMTSSLQKLIVDEHNKKRNIIAGGDDDFKPACRMATMEWDDELAKLAEYNVMQCKMNHDDCHNTEDFKYSGQNLGSIGFSDNKNDTEQITKSIKLWFEEKKDVDQSILDEYPSDYSGPDIGHFTVMMVDRNIRVGCAAATYSKDSHNNYLFACNYASTNMVGFPIYKSCDKAADDCESGTNSSYKNLCSTSESYDVNKFQLKDSFFFNLYV